MWLAYFGHCRISMMGFFEIIVLRNSFRNYFHKKTPSKIFGRVLNTLLSYSTLNISTYHLKTYCKCKHLKYYAP